MSKNLDFRNDAFRPYAIALGELALVWNDLQMALQYLFWMVSKIPNGLVPFAMWNSLKSDRTQRDMLKALINLDVFGHSIPEPLQTEMIWLLQEIERLENKRNDFLHSPFLDHGNGLVSPWHELGNQRAKKLAGKDILRELKWFYDAAVVLREYAMELSDACRRPHDALLPRAKLPNRGES